MMKSSSGDVVRTLIIAAANGLIQLWQISFSGCDDNQTSADVVKNGLAVGAMSYAFMKCLGAFVVYFHFRGWGN